MTKKEYNQIVKALEILVNDLNQDTKNPKIYLFNYQDYHNSKKLKLRFGSNCISLGINDGIRGVHGYCSTWHNYHGGFLFGDRDKSVSHDTASGIIEQLNKLDRLVVNS